LAARAHGSPPRYGGGEVFGAGNRSWSAGYRRPNPSDRPLEPLPQLGFRLPPQHLPRAPVYVAAFKLKEAGSSLSVDEPLEVLAGWNEVEFTSGARKVRWRTKPSEEQARLIRLFGMEKVLPKAPPSA